MISIAILGFGNIGSGVADIIKNNQAKIAAALGDTVIIKYVLDKRDLSGTAYADAAVSDIEVILSDPDVSVVCEMLGGTQPAYDFSMAALQAGKSVVTSNKEVVSRFGVSLSETAKAHGVHYLFEASVGGGIPVIHAMNDSLKGCDIRRIDGILNGTTNYILTRMHDCSSSFEDALEEARRLGYAEANPTADISGADTCRKIAILSALAWGKLPAGEDISCEGITDITTAHNDFAARCGGVLKLCATARREEEALSVIVSPCVVMNDNPLSSVKGVFNAVKIDAGDLGDVMFYGMGAGKLPTASAVVSDVMAAVSGHVGYELKWQENDERLVDEALCREAYCVAVKADKDTVTARLPERTLLYEEDTTVYFLSEELSKEALLAALDGIAVVMLMRAII